MSTTPTTAVRPQGIRIVDLSRRYGPRWAVARVTLSVQPGEALMITGANGSGKSTMLRCIATALKPHEGQILFGGRDLWKERHQLRAHLAYLGHQLHVYDDLSGVENLRVWARLGAIRADPAALLERVGLDPARADPVRAFSAGMKRRLALARMLLKQPSLVLLDEPFSALDPVGRELVIELAQQLRDGGATVVMATHMPDVAKRVCSHAATLEGGQLVWQGHPSELGVGATP